MKPAFTEWVIIRALVRTTFSDAACLVPNVTYFGGEIDLVVVKPNRMLIDCEVKTSRGDLKADVGKDKWWQHGDGVWSDVERRFPYPDKIALAWPRYAWKHYYAMPETIWDEALLPNIKPMSGVLLLTPEGKVRCRRGAKARLDAKPLTDKHLMAMCRLATLRMWDALGRQ